MKQRTLIIAKKDIFFDVDAVTHLFSTASEGRGLHYSDALESDTEDNFSKTLLSRFADRRVAELKERLNKFLPTESLKEEEAVISMGDAYIIDLEVEDAFQDELLSSLTSEVESYIAKGCIADWYASFGDAQAATYSQQLPSSYMTILEYLVKRKFPTRI